MSNDKLLAAGWRIIRVHADGSARWTHADMPSINGRRRLFNTEQALTLLDASNAAQEAEDAVETATGD